MERKLTPYLMEDLQEKMLFLAGPRQCGKTTIAKQILANQKGTLYLNWDSVEDRKIITERSWDEKEPLVVFDELHKFPKWKSWLKGLWDKRNGAQNYLVTGSARLDVYRKGGDSLMGRYHHWRLHPLTIEELSPLMPPEEALLRLMAHGGFPEPFIKNSLRFSRRWRRERYEKVIKEDIRDLESVRNITGISLLVDLLRTRVGGCVVVSHLAQDLQVTHKTVELWLRTLENMYVIFRVMPYGGTLARTLQKPPKFYFYDVADVEGDEGARFENLVACALLQRCHFLEDYEGHRMGLFYVRDKEGREVDFAILKEKKLLTLIEAKWQDASLSPSLHYFTERMKPEDSSYQIVGKATHSMRQKGITISPATTLLSDLSWVS